MQSERLSLLSGINLSSDFLHEIAVEDNLQPAILEFNQKPAAGVPLLCEACGLPQTPESIATIFHTVSGLLGDQIGSYLAKAENQETLRAYFYKLDLALPFLPALRKALCQSLHLPGEGELIDRIVQTWAQCYVEANPNCGMNADQCYILAFACVLLNSDLHNPACRRRMNVGQFINNVRGAIKAGDISDEVLTEIYASIKSEAFAFRKDDGSDFLALSAPRMKGELEKRSKRFGSVWKVHFFVLADSSLYYFRDRSKMSEDAPQGVIQLVGVDFNAIGDDKIEVRARKNTFLQYVKFRRRKRPEIVKGIRVMEFGAASREIRDKWLYRMRTSCVYQSFATETPAAEASAPVIRTLSLDEDSVREAARRLGAKSDLFVWTLQPREFNRTPLVVKSGDNMLTAAIAKPRPERVASEIRQRRANLGSRRRDTCDDYMLALEMQKQEAKAVEIKPSLSLLAVRLDNDSSLS